jgi:Ca-activated chloride channel family protein
MLRIKILLFLFSFYLFSFSQSPGSIKGTVRNVKNDAPVSNVKIIFLDDSTVIDSVFTNDNGVYYYTKLPNRNLSMTVSKIGFHSKEISQVFIQSNQLAKFNFYMQEGDSIAETGSYSFNGDIDPNGLKMDFTKNISFGSGMYNVTLNNCIVTCYKVSLIDHGATGATITREDIAKMPMRNTNAIAGTVGGVITDEQNNIVSIRGSRSNNVNYYVDGIRVKNLNGVQYSSINDISVLTGGLPANYGDVTGGVIAVNTLSYHDYPRRNNSEVYSNTTIEDGIIEPFEKPFFDEKFNRESYEMIYENEFLAPEHEPLSTFSIDVDKASYSNVRRILRSGQTPSAGAVRIEEMINYFQYKYQAPQDTENPIAVHTELGNCPWNKDHKLLKIGMKGFEVPIDNTKPSNLVFLIDVSGSMTDQDKLPLLKSAFNLLLEKLNENDLVSIVVYAGASGTVLTPTSGAQKSKIRNALTKLRAGGSTNGASGIKEAYRLAMENFIEEGNNRVILATDGDFNVGISSNDELEKLIVKKRESGVFLTTLGFGTGNYQDDRMEMLADKGNGNYFYIDNVKEAKKALVTEMFGTLYTIAKDVKLQLEFNPKEVESYRLIGYENRLLAPQDFNDDKKDAGEIGSGHTVTALYEVIPTKSKDPLTQNNIDPLRYQKTKHTLKSHSNELVQIKCRYKYPDSDTSKLQTFHVLNENTEVSLDFNFAAAVASYGMILRESEYINNFSLDQVYSLAEKNIGEDKNGYREEFLKLIRKAESLIAFYQD